MVVQWCHITWDLFQYKEADLPVQKITPLRQPCDHFVSTMGFPALVRWQVYTETVPYSITSLGKDYTLSQSPCTALRAGILSAVRAVQRDCHWSLKNGGNSHWSYEPRAPSNPNLYLDQPITKGRCQHPTDSPITTRLGLCSSLGKDLLPFLHKFII